MTKQEKKIKRYVNAIERELRLPLKAKARINGDIGTDIHARLEKGQSIDEIIAEMGTPQEVAAGFNEESPWRWVFLIAAILAGGAALLSILPFLLFYFQSSGMGVIGGADGPTAIFITGAANLLAPVLTPLWLAVPFILGCCAACVLLRWGQNGPRAKHTLALMFSAAALLCWLLLGILSLWQASSAVDATAGIAVLSWKTLLFQLFNLMLLPSFWLPVVTLCIAARRRKTASPRQ